jgi:hypothetical protein
MDFISVLIGMGLGIISCLIGIGLKILYIKISPLLTVYSAVKQFDNTTEDFYKSFIDNLSENKDKDK